MLTLAGLKKDLQLHSLYTECIGQLKSRSDDIFFGQPARKFLVAIAGGADHLEVLMFYRNHAILRSGPQPLSLKRDSEGIRWLCKVLSSSPAAMGFVAELPPFVSNTPAGLFQCKYFCAARYNTWLLNKVTPNGIMCLLFFLVFLLYQECCCKQAA